MAAGLVVKRRSKRGSAIGAALLRRVVAQVDSIESQLLPDVDALTKSLMEENAKLKQENTNLRQTLGLQDNAMDVQGLSDRAVGESVAPSLHMLFVEQEKVASDANGEQSVQDATEIETDGLVRSDPIGDGQGNEGGPQHGGAVHI